MNMKTIQYKNGTVFLVPLRDYGYVRGVVARSNQKGLVFGYFFEPRVSLNEVDQNDVLQPENAIVLLQFGGLGLESGEWPILGIYKNWKEFEWPMPSFIRKDDFSNTYYVTKYDEVTFKAISEKRFEGKKPKGNFPKDRISGYGAVELILTHILKSEN